MGKKFVFSMEIDDDEWIFMRIAGIKCCYTCKKYRDNTCGLLETVEKYFRLKEMRYRKFKREDVGCECGRYA